MKHIIVLFTLVFGLGLIGCGGGGSGETAATYTPEVEELKPLYNVIKVAMEDNAGDPTVRTNTIMTNVSADFVDNQDVPNYAELQSTTLSRLDRYEVVEYTPTINSSTKLEEGLLAVSTTIKLTVILKPGKTGNANGTYYVSSEVRWKKVNGTWVISKGLPYKNTI